MEWITNDLRTVKGRIQEGNNEARESRSYETAESNACSVQGGPVLTACKDPLHSLWQHWHPRVSVVTNHKAYMMMAALPSMLRPRYLPLRVLAVHTPRDVDSSFSSRTRSTLMMGRVAATDGTCIASGTMEASFQDPGPHARF
jgi:hypothetical protein